MKLGIKQLSGEKNVYTLLTKELRKNKATSHSTFLLSLLIILPVSSFEG